jgi:hypothetical protein
MLASYRRQEKNDRNRQKCFGGNFGTFLQRPVAAADGSKRFNRSFLRRKVASEACTFAFSR